MGTINDFIRESIKKYYEKIQSEVRVMLVDTNEKLLAEVDEELGEFALEKLKAKGVSQGQEALYTISYQLHTF